MGLLRLMATTIMKMRNAIPPAATRKARSIQGNHALPDRFDESPESSKSFASANRSSWVVRTPLSWRSRSLADSSEVIGLLDTRPNPASIGVYP